MGVIKNAYKLLSKNMNGGDLLEGFTHRWEDNIRKNAEELEWEDVNWIHVD
jgi:hypothetical protein